MIQSLEKIEYLLEQKSVTLADLLKLRSKLNVPFRLHPLGFFACTLLTEGTRKLRLHYWPVAGATQQSPECQIHDHLFEFRSWVLTGAVENIEYIISSEGRELAVYQTEYSGNQSILSKMDFTLKLTEQKRKLYQAGSSYSMSAGVLHETVRLGSEPVFTVLVTNDVSTSAPVVLGPINGQQQYIYERDIVQESVVVAMLAEAGY
ncbi:hypothetical protein [Aeromonas salmonicida]|uniref:hypothetical protein n=1 Tax=Aeromonas salmonicida TaxID=645 RepID=UPI00259F6AB0|nr:hypothetical protein [Aeromonas salmonicida]MDM5102466.1 hypothetical protein [Aeromonas salmonicida]